MSRETVIRIIPVFILTALFLNGCAAKMSLEEAKKVSLSMESPSLNAPSRRINDILEVLDQSGKYDDKIARLHKAKASKAPPVNENDGKMAVFYHERGEAARQLGRTKQALDDLRTALSYSQKAGMDDPALLRHLGIVEQVSGNFRKAVDLFEKALEIKDEMGTYDHLINAYIQMGDLETAKSLNLESIDALDKKRKKKNAYRNSSMREAHMRRIDYDILEAEGKHSEAEKYIRRELDLYLSLKDTNPRSAIISRLNLASNLNHQNRLLEAEIEARETITESLGLGGADSELAAKAVLTLA
ncbi:MAG: tetratricopeptide repeat protein, partial [Syntrophales bacterium]|nr:tetratricopeptide repeat protein [Syntrophales bacterium]